MIPTKRLIDFETFQRYCEDTDLQHSGDWWCTNCDHPNHNTHIVAHCDVEDCPVWNELRKSTKAREDTLIEIRAATMHGVDCCVECQHCRVHGDEFICVLIGGKPYPCEPDGKCGLFECS